MCRITKEVLGLAVVAAFLWTGCSTAPESTDRFLTGQLTTIEIGDEITARLGNNDPINAVDGSAYRVYELRSTGDETVAIRVTTADFAPRIALFAPDGTLIEKSTHSTTTDLHHASYPPSHQAPRPVIVVGHLLESGSYRLVVSGDEAQSRGTFTLRSESIDSPPALEFGESANYILHHSSETRPGTAIPKIVHPLEVEELRAAEIHLRSDDFDAYLMVADADTGEILGENDDWGGTTNSRLVLELEPGSYEIWATAFDAPASGAYTVQVEEIEIERSEQFVVGIFFRRD